MVFMYDRRSAVRLWWCVVDLWWCVVDLRWSVEGLRCRERALLLPYLVGMREIPVRLAVGGIRFRCLWGIVGPGRRGVTRFLARLDCGGQRLVGPVAFRGILQQGVAAVDQHIPVPLVPLRGVDRAAIRDGGGKLGGDGTGEFGGEGFPAGNSHSVLEGRVRFDAVGGSSW